MAPAHAAALPSPARATRAAFAARRRGKRGVGGGRGGAPGMRLTLLQKGVGQRGHLAVLLCAELIPAVAHLAGRQRQGRLSRQSSWGRRAGRGSYGPRWQGRQAPGCSMLRWAAAAACRQQRNAPQESKAARMGVYHLPSGQGPLAGARGHRSRCQAKTHSCDLQVFR